MPEMEGDVTPGILHKFKLPLLNISTCRGMFSDDLPDGIFCAGGMGYKMKEGGLLPFLKKKMTMMKMMEGGMDEEEMMGEEGMMRMMEKMEMMKEEGEFNFDLLSVLAHLQNSVDMMEGGVGRNGMRKAGTWSLGYEEMMKGMGGGMLEREGMEEEEEAEEDGERDDGMMMGEKDMEMEEMMKEMMEHGMGKEEIMKMMMMKQCKVISYLFIYSLIDCLMIGSFFDWLVGWLAGSLVGWFK